VEFYSKSSPKVGQNFEAEVQRLIRSIQRFPNAGVSSSERTRTRFCKRFPYGVIYRVLPDEIQIVSVMHRHRLPNYWTGRVS